MDERWKRENSELGMLVRYADDLVVMCDTAAACEEAERRIGEILSDLGLELHPGNAARKFGSGGQSRPFGLGLSPAPMAADRSSSRSPRIRACAVAAQPPHGPMPPNHRASTHGVVSPQGGRPSMAFVFLGNGRLSPPLRLERCAPRGLATSLSWYC